MLREAELFAVAERVLVEVLGRIRDQDLDIVLPHLSDLPGIDGPSPLRAVLQAWAYDDAGVPKVLVGGSPDDIDRAAIGSDLGGKVRQATVSNIAATAGEAAQGVDDGDAVVHARYGDTPARDYLLRLTINRSLVAHYIAAYLGSTACPLPEELARPLWERTAPDAASWRTSGIFREPLPIPDKASWRDTFLRTGGHEPHPLGH